MDIVVSLTAIVAAAAAKMSVMDITFWLSCGTEPSFDVFARSQGGSRPNWELPRFGTVGNAVLEGGDREWYCVFSGWSG